MKSTRVADLTVNEFKRIVRETVAQTLAELLSDPDEGLALRDELRTELIAALRGPKGQYETVQTVAERFDLNW